MPRVKKNSEAMREMCGRLERLLKYLYGGDVGRMQGLMQYGHQSTLKKALATQDSFPDVERFHFLLQHPVHGCIVPNMNWIVSGMEKPLLRLTEDGKVSEGLSFGTYIDQYQQQITKEARRGSDKTKKEESKPLAAQERRRHS